MNKDDISPQEVARFFITEIQEMAKQLEPRTMPYDWSRIVKTHDAMSDLVAFNHIGAIKRHEPH